MLRARLPSAHHFTVSIFGCQYHASSPSHAKQGLIDAFENLIEAAAIHVEKLEQTDLPSKIWMGYWASPQAFKVWWEDAAVSSFWRSLPDTAGFWRETISIPATRAMYESNKRIANGFGHCGERIPLTEKTGYWGAYRSRLTPDSDEDMFSSSTANIPPPRPLSNLIRPGRVRVSRFPDNICFVVEGQEFGAMNDRERAFWIDNFDALTKHWVKTVVTAGSEKGMLSARACHGATSKKQPWTQRVDADSDDHVILLGLNYLRQVQLLFWHDISKMEHIGRSDRGHVKLRREFLAAYGPGGVMEGGDLLLWVDLAVLKGQEMDAEYVGCYDGTGFLAFENDPAYVLQQGDVVAKLPAIFDKPIQSHPIQW